jgi:hypothetical protein
VPPRKREIDLVPWRLADAGRHHRERLKSHGAHHDTNGAGWTRRGKRGPQTAAGWTRTGAALGESGSGGCRRCALRPARRHDRHAPGQRECGQISPDFAHDRATAAKSKGSRSGRNCRFRSCAASARHPSLVWGIACLAEARRRRRMAHCAGRLPQLARAGGGVIVPEPCVTLEVDQEVDVIGRRRPAPRFRAGHEQPRPH